MTTTTSMPNFIDCEQGSELWAASRCGLVTASRCADMLAKIKKGVSASRSKYRAELVIEILTGQPYPQYVSQEMQWGTDQEPFGRAAYEMQQDVLVETCGFVLHPTLPRFGASPDGLVGEDGMIQVKCPNTSTHLNCMLSGVVPVEYAPQMLAEMACAGRQWSDFVSFDPRLPKHLQLFVRRLERDQKLIVALEAEVVKFTAEVDDVLAKLPQPEAGQPVVAVLDQDLVDEPELESAPAPVIDRSAEFMPKPKIDDVDRKTGKPKFANYGEYELAKDDWLQQDTIRQIREMLNLVMGTQKVQ